MKILVDTNVIISAIVFGGKPRVLLLYLIEKGHSLIVSDYIVNEFSDIAYRKWPDKAEKVIEVFKKMDFSFVESSNEKADLAIRDEKDIQVLSDALLHNADIILTGDKDFLEADIERPMAFSVAMLDEFLKSDK